MERILRALIADDEENARKLLNKLLEETLYFCEIKEAQYLAKAISESEATADTECKNQGNSGIDSLNFLISSFM